MSSNLSIPCPRSKVFGEKSVVMKESPVVGFLIFFFSGVRESTQWTASIKDKIEEFRSDLGTWPFLEV